LASRGAKNETTAALAGELTRELNRTEVYSSVRQKDVDGAIKGSFFMATMHKKRKKKR
jgi:hypothetical protein